MKKIILLILSALLVFGLCSCDQNSAELEALQKRIADLEAQLEATDEANTKERQRLELEISRLNERCNNLTEHDLEIIDRITALEDLSDRVSTLEEDLLDTEGALATLAGIVDDYCEKLEEDEGSFEDFKDDVIATIVSDIASLKTTAAELEEKLTVTEEVEAIQAKIAQMESRINSHFHVNLTTGAYEAHTFQYETHEEYHIYKCTVCGYIDTNKSNPHYYAGYATSNLFHQQTCDECHYTEGPKSHTLDYEGAGTTEEEWNENFPVMENLHVKGSIYEVGSYARIKFPTLPNLKRDTANALVCSDCSTTVYKVINQGNGTGEYQLTYFPDLKHEYYVKDADEYMFRIGNIEGTMFLYLRNYSVSAYSGDLKVHEWKCEGKTFREWGFVDQVWTCIYEEDIAGGTLTELVDWNGIAPWGTVGYVIEGDVYCMGFGSGNFYDKVSYVVTDEGFVERPYGNDIEHELLN